MPIHIVQDEFLCEDSHESYIMALDKVYRIDSKSMDDVYKCIEKLNDTIEDAGTDDLIIWLNEFMIVND